MRIRADLVTHCSSFDQLKIVMFFKALKDGVGLIRVLITRLTPGYVNTLTLCKTGLGALEK
jgi:hypothetical protein